MGSLWGMAYCAENSGRSVIQISAIELEIADSKLLTCATFARMSGAVLCRVRHCNGPRHLKNYLKINNLNLVSSPHNPLVGGSSPPGPTR